MKKTLLYKIKKGWKRSIPFTFIYLWKIFYRVECEVNIIPKEYNLLIRLFGIKHGIHPGRCLEVFIDNKDIVIILNDITIYRKHFYHFDLRVEYTSRDNIKQIVFLLPDDTMFTYRYIATEKITHLLTPKAYKSLKNYQDIIWKIML